MINCHHSPFSNIVCGSPQSRILWPLSNNAYRNDVVNITNQTKFIIYADDTTPIFSRNDADDLIGMANMGLNKVFLIPEVNDLKISALKKTNQFIPPPVNKLVDITNPLSHYIFSSVLELLLVK